MDQHFKKEIEELIKTGRDANKIDKGRAELFENLINTPAWKLYLELLGALIDARGMAVLAPASSIDRAIGLEYIKGTMSGLIMARDIPSLIVAAMKPAVPDADGEDR